MRTIRTSRIAGLLLASSAIFGLGQSALANGMGTPVEPPPEQPAPTMMEPAAEPVAVAEPEMAAKWEGFYIGGLVGYAFQPEDEDETILFDTNLDGNFGDTINTAGGANAFSPGFCGGSFKANNAAAGCDEDEDGWEFGARIGYDWQFGNFVIGALLEGSWIDAEDSVTAFSVTPAAYEFTRELNFLAGGRLRAGFASDSFLIYGTGGIAYGDIERTFDTTNAVNTFSPLKEDDSAWGYQIGGGGEVLVSDGISLGLEYLYTSLDDEDYVVRVGPGTAPATNPFILVNTSGTDLTREDDNFDIHSVRAVVNFRFGGM